MSTHASRLHSLRRLAFSLLAGSIFTTITAAAGWPRVHETLDFGWRFLQGDAPEATNAAFNDSGWRTVDVPHDWSIEGDFNRTNAMSAASGYLPSGIGWYRQTITAPPAWSGKRVMVEFEGVYMNADVWLNGEHLGFHPYGYNYALRNAPADHTRVPSRIIVCTESLPRATFESWSHVHDESYVIGDFVWTAIDYIGEAAIGRYSYSTDTNTANRGFGGRTTQLYPWNGSFCGDLDLAGFRKPISHYRNIIFERGEKLYMAVREPEINGRTIRLGNNWSLWPMSENWTWPGLEGTNISVEVYSTAEKVQLYLNDKLIGEQPTTRTQQFMATFKVPYAPGKLRAVALQNGRKIADQVLTTTGDAARIKLTPDHSTISADGQDLSYVTVEVTDKSGQRQPNADQMIHFSISGPGVTAGVDNGSDRSEERHQADQRSVWQGRALVVIRSTKAGGRIQLTATSPGLANATVDDPVTIERPSKGC